MKIVCRCCWTILLHLFKVNWGTLLAKVCCYIRIHFLSTCLNTIFSALHELLLSGGCVCSVCSSFAWLGLFFFSWIYVVKFLHFLLICLWYDSSRACFGDAEERNLHLNYIFLFSKYKKETNFVCAESEMNDLCANFNLEVVCSANGSHWVSSSCRSCNVPFTCLGYLSFFPHCLWGSSLSFV